MKYKAEISSRESGLTSDWSVSMACKWFNLTEAELESIVGGRKTRGASAGKLRGGLAWSKTVRGGWVKTGQYNHDAQHGNGYVIAPNTIVFRALLNKDGEVVKFFTASGFEYIEKNFNFNMPAASVASPAPVVVENSKCYAVKVVGKGMSIDMTAAGLVTKEEADKIAAEFNANLAQDQNGGDWEVSIVKQ